MLKKKLMKQRGVVYKKKYKFNSLYFISLTQMKLVSVVVLLSLILLSQSAVTTPIEAFGTVLPQLNYNSVSTPYRIFNDLMKQSLNLVPYQLSSWGSVGRCWSCSLNLINGAKHQYPANLQPNVWAVAEIPFFAG